MAAGSVVSALSGRCLLQLEDVPATVGEVKQRVQDVLGIRKYKQRIFYEGALQGDYFELATLDQPLRLGLIEVPYAPVEETREDLGDAALQGNVAKLKSLLCLPANPNEGFGDPPLHLAFSCVSSGAMDLLLDALADPNCECQEYFDAVWAGTPLHLVTLAVEGEDDAAHATRILCDARADVNVSDSRGDAPLTLAARYGLWAVVGLLCAAKADLNFAAPERDGDCGNTPLQKAAWRDDVSMVHRLCELRADPNLPDENGITPLGAATIVAGQPRTAMLTLLEYRADVDAGRTSPLSLASACSTPRSGLDAEDRLGARLLLEAGASKEKALTGEREFGLGNFFFIGHQNTEQQRRAVEELIEAHNEDSAWLRWYTSEKALSITEHAVLPPELAPAQRVVYAWRGSVDHCTHGVLLRNSGRAARETSYELMRSYNRAHGLQLTIEHFDQQLSDCLRLLPDDPK